MEPEPGLQRQALAQWNAAFYVPYEPKWTCSDNFTQTASWTSYRAVSERTQCVVGEQHLGALVQHNGDNLLSTPQLGMFTELSHA